MVTDSIRPLHFTRCCVAGLLLTMMITLYPAVGRGGEAEMERVRREYPAACAKLERFYQQISGTCLFKIVQPGRSPSSWRMSFATQGTSRKVTITGKSRAKSPTPIEQVFCVSDRASFCVDRNPDVPQSG